TGQVTTLGAFTNTGGGDFQFSNAQALTVTGPVTTGGLLALATTAGDLTLTGAVSAGGNMSLMTSSGAIVLGGALAAATNLTLESAGAITQTGGNITASVLFVQSNGDVSLTQPGNNIATLGAVLTGFGAQGNFTLVDAQTGMLNLTGTVNTGNGSSAGAI